MTQHYCPTCQTEVAEEAKRCNACGTSFEALRPVTREEMASSSKGRTVVVVVLAVVAVILCLGIALFYEVMSGLAAGH